MAMIGPLPDSPAAPTPWRVDDVFPRRVNDAKGEPLFSVDGLALTHDQDAALARELVDLVNRAAASSATYADAYEVGYRNALADAALSDPEPVEGPAEPDPRDPSTWRRYVDEVGDEWFEFAPGRVGCGSRDALVRFVSDRLSCYPETLGEDLDDARDWFDLRRA